MMELVVRCQQEFILGLIHIFSAIAKYNINASLAFRDLIGHHCPMHFCDSHEYILVSIDLIVPRKTSSKLEISLEQLVEI